MSIIPGASDCVHHLISLSSPVTSSPACTLSSVCPVHVGSLGWGSNWSGLLRSSAPALQHPRTCPVMDALANGYHDIPKNHVPECERRSKHCSEN
jgi:hypothetical protein